jgi:deoxyribonuclease-1/deoxyribonuclease-1-like protein
MKRPASIALVSILVLALALGAILLFLPRTPAIPAAPTVATSAPELIKVGSYNLAIFGSTKLARPGTLGILARIASGYDLLAVQEVGSNASSASDETCEAVMSAFVARIDQEAGAPVYAFARSNQYAFIYRQDRLELRSSGPYEGREAFTYRPLVAVFQVKGRPLDFAVLTIHTRPSLAKAEIPALARAMDELALSLGEKDVLCLGDFNADGSYYPEGEGQTLSGFPAGRYLTLIPNEADTTVAEDSLAYDRMEASLDLREDWAGTWGVIRPASVWDLSACEGGAESAGTERALSDHYPVWAEFSTLRDSD